MDLSRSPKKEAWNFSVVEFLSHDTSSSVAPVCRTDLLGRVHLCRASDSLDLRVELITVPVLYGPRWKLLRLLRDDIETNLLHAILVQVITW